jgi:hypothetical protein
MKSFARAVVIAGGGALLLGASLAVSSVAPVSGASEIQPAKVKASCNSTAPCTNFKNSGSGAGVEGTSSGSSPSVYNLGAIQGDANGLNGTYAYSSGRNGGFFENNTSSYYSLFSFQDNSSGYSFGAQNSSTGDYFSVDEDGDGYFSGDVDATAYDTHLRVRGGYVRAFNAISTRQTIEDTGTARLMNGEAAVRFDGPLANAIDIRQGYQVFLTPDGETRGLFVSQKYEGGFIVREIEHGRSNIMFDYRVVAHPVGSTDQRLPAITLKALPVNNPGHIPQ